MSGTLLRSGRLREYNALGAVGRPVHTAAPQLRALIKRTMGPTHADVLAVPQINEGGDSIDWYAPFDGTVVPWSSATEAERAPARQAVQQAREEFHRKSADLLAQAAGNQEKETFARLLQQVAEIPDESHVYLVDGRPVLTFWGFRQLNAPAGADVVRDLGLRPAAAAPKAPVAPVAVAPVPVVPVVPWWRRWWWLLLLLLLLPLLLFLLFGLRGCGIDVPVPGLAVPALDAPSGTLPQAPAMAVPGVAIPNGSVPGVAVPGGVVPGVDVPQTPPPAHDGPAVPPPVPSLRPPGAADAVPPPVLPGAAHPPAAKDAVPPPPLVLPDKAMKDGSTVFLYGHWRSRTGLMDSQTGLPLDVEYDFKDGKGIATILRSDGTRCPAPVEASIQGGKLILNQTAEARCSDGQVFDSSRVECRQGKDGKAECRGVHADGSSYFVEIVK